MPPTATYALNPQQMAQLARELQAMIAAGVPLHLGLRSAAGSLPGGLEGVAERLALRLEEGVSLSDALAGEPSVPSPYRAVLAAGMRCGREDQMLRDFSEMTASFQGLRSSLRGAMVYPLSILLTAVGLLAVLSAWSFPRILALYADTQLAVPAWLAWLSWDRLPWLLAGGVFMAAFAWVVLSRSGDGLTGLRWAPGGKRLVRDFQLAQLSHLLGLLVRHQVPLDEALKLTAGTVISPLWQGQLLDLARKVERGESLEVASRQAGSLPPFLVWLISRGEQDSDLGSAFEQAADHYRERAWVRGERLRQVIPALTLFLVGGGVTFVYCLLIVSPLIHLWSALGAER